MKVLEDERDQPGERNPSDLEEGGSGYQEEDSQKTEEVKLESNENRPSLNHQGSEAPNHGEMLEKILQTEKSLKVELVGPEKEIKGCGGNKTVRTSDLPLNDSLADEKTWYFTWR